MMRLLLGAVQFLTVIPVPGSTAPAWRTAVLFPLVGGVIGALGAGLWLLADALPVSLRALLVVLFWIWITGSLHEDGLADVADACRAGRSRERMLGIMKDSRVGVYGVVAVVGSVLLRWQALAAIMVPVIPSLIAVLAISRAAIVLLARIAKAAGDGSGAAFSTNISGAVALLAVAQAAAAAAWCGPALGAAMLGLSLLVVLACRFYFHRRIGGVTGDCLGAAAQAVEIALLLLLTCPISW